MYNFTVKLESSYNNYIVEQNMKKTSFLFGTRYFQKEQFYTEKGDINIATMMELESYISRANEYLLKYDLEDYIPFF